MPTPQHLLSRRTLLALVALVMTAGVVLAVSTYASAGKKTIAWKADGSKAICKPVAAGKKCVKTRGTVTTYWNTTFSYKTKLRPGTYRILLNYRSSGTNPPAGYNHNLKFKANGQEVDASPVPWRSEGGGYLGEEFQIKKPLKNLSIEWSNDIYQPPTDINFSVAKVVLERIGISPQDYPGNTSRYWAAKILEDNALGKDAAQISMTDEARGNLKEIEAGRCSPIEEFKACVKLDRRVLKAVYQVSRQKKFRVWHFTGGPHVACSNHFEGRAVDLQEFDGSWPKNGRRDVLDDFRRQGANELLGPGDPNHDNHWHIGWNGPNTTAKRYGSC